MSMVHSFRVLCVAICITILRKYIATFTGMPEVGGGHEVERLDNFMGHDKEIHRGIYRVPVPAAEMTNVSCLLVAAKGEDEDENI